MTIKIVAHGDDKRERVEAFNRRMREGGSHLGFYVEPQPRWIPKRLGQKVWRELYLAVENEGAVVGGYALKPQHWLVHGETVTITDWQGPFSLGAIDKHYAALGLRMVRDMLKKHPLLYSWGHGGNEEPIVKMLRKMGWLLHPTPFLLRIVHPSRFLRKNQYLRSDRKKAIVQDVLAFSGLGSLGIHALHKALRLKSGMRLRARAEPVDVFGPWADDLWDQYKHRYAAIALRDAATMNALVPAEHVTLEWPPPTRLRVSREGRLLGWAVVLEQQLDADPLYGTLRVGMIADSFGAPNDAAEIVHAAFDHLRREGVDIVFANQANPAWVAGFVDAGFVAVPDRRMFCAAPALEKLMWPFEKTRRGLFLTNMDGHGPML